RMACSTRYGINPRHLGPTTLPNRRLSAIPPELQAHSRHASSAATFVTPYAPTGFIELQRGRAPLALPYTALDEARTTRAGRIALSTLIVPLTFVLMRSPSSLNGMTTSALAARWITISGRMVAASWRNRSASRTSVQYEFTGTD